MADLVDVLVQPALSADPEALLKTLAEQGVALACLASVTPQPVPSLAPGALGALRTVVGVGLLPGAGWDPPRALPRLVEALGDPRVGLVGEVGLDRRQNMPPLAEQTGVLAAVLKAAVGADLPVLLHAVRAHGALLEVLDRAPRARAAVHGFTGSAEAAADLVRRGLLVSFGPALLNPAARRARLAAAAVPDDHLLVESDAPTYPVAQIHEVLQLLAQLRGQRVGDVQRVTAANARRWLKGPGSIGIDPRREDAAERG